MQYEKGGQVSAALMCIRCQIGLSVFDVLNLNSSVYLCTQKTIFNGNGLLVQHNILLLIDT